MGTRDLTDVTDRDAQEAHEAELERVQAKFGDDLQGGA